MHILYTELREWFRIYRINNQPREAIELAAQRMEFPAIIHRLEKLWDDQRENLMDAVLAAHA